MDNRKTILHIIQNFGRGGAETAVVGILKELTGYKNIVVTLNELNEFGDELKYDKYYCLNLRSYYLFPLAIKKLKKIIKENNVDLVHSQLYWSTILARFACPNDTPLVTSIQASLSNSVEYKRKWIGWLDKISYNRKRSTTLGVSKHTLDDYFRFLKLQPYENYVLYNFVDNKIFATPLTSSQNESKVFKIISVGNLKAQKNHQFLLNAFLKLKDQDICLDIYGDGLLYPELSKFIKNNNLPVRLMGKIKNLNEVITGYDLFVMSSFYEGFSLAVLEAMAMKMPMLLSDIPTFKEECEDTAVYFNLNDTDEFCEKLKALIIDPGKRKIISEKAQKRVLENFTLSHHMQELKKIYTETFMLYQKKNIPDFLEIK